MTIKEFQFNNMTFTNKLAIVNTDKICRDTDTMENSLFINAVINDFRQMPVSQAIPFLQFIATEYDLKLCFVNDFDKAKTILFNSIQYN